jgi:hypothetical protein
MLVSFNRLDGLQCRLRQHRLRCRRLRRPRHDLPSSTASPAWPGLAWPGLTVSYTVEILPYQIRAKGHRAVASASRLSAGVFNQYVNPIGIQNLAPGSFYFVYIAILVIECLVIYFYYVETCGPTLEEIAQLFDGDDAHVAAAMPGLEEGLGGNG